MTVITNYATLQTAVSDYLARDDLTTYIPNFIQNCENKLYRTMHLRDEENLYVENVSSGKVNLPTLWKAHKFAYYQSGQETHRLQWVTLDEMYDKYPNRSETTTAPKLIAREQSSLIFGPVAADGSAVLKGIYYAKPQPLRDNDNTWYVTNAPEVLLYGSLLEAKPFIMDDARIPVWQQFFAEAVATLETAERISEMPQGGLIVQRGSNMP